MLDLVEHVILLVSFGLCCLNMVGICIQFVVNCTLSSYHVNFRIVYVNLLLALALISFGFFVSIIFMFLEETPTPTGEYARIFKYVQFGTQYGNYMMRTVFIAIFIERMFATILRKNYEKKRFFVIAIFDVILIHAATISLMVMWYYSTVKTTIFLQQTILISLDLVAIVCILILMSFNKKLRRIQNHSDTDLSQRYQISENIRVVKAVAPINLACGFVNLLTSVTSATAVNLSLFSRYRELVFNLMMNLNVFVALVLLLKLGIVRHRLARMVPFIRDGFRNVVENKALKFALEMTGLKAEKGQDVHFEGLHKMWN